MVPFQCVIVVISDQKRHEGFTTIIVVLGLNDHIEGRIKASLFITDWLSLLPLNLYTMIHRDYSNYYYMFTLTTSTRSIVLIRYFCYYLLRSVMLKDLEIDTRATLWLGLCIKSCQHRCDVLP